MLLDGPRKVKKISKFMGGLRTPDARGWTKDCEEYFEIYGVKEPRRAATAALHLDGIPKSWYNGIYGRKKGGIMGCVL